MDDEIRSILEELQNVHYPAGPIQQRNQKLQALINVDKNELEAIYYLIESHAVGLRTRAIFRYEKLEARNKISDLSCKENVDFNCANSDVKENVQHLLRQLEEMPKEWSLVQLTPQLNWEENIETDPNTYHTSPLHVSVLNCGKKAALPFCVNVDSPHDATSGNVMELAQEMHALIVKNKQILQGNPKKFFENRNERQVYNNQRKELDDNLRNIVKDVQNLWLKEWRCLLIGKYVNEATERNILHHLEDFFKKEAPNLEVSDKIKNLLVYIVKGCCYLSLMEVKRAVAYCFPNPNHKNLVKQLAQFVRHLFSKLHLIGEKKHPVILIVDELLDFFPWEMMDVLSGESVSRVPSFHFAYALFKVHQKDIVDGHKIVNDYKNGAYIVDPDSNLERMQTRITSFFKYWMPEWNGIAGSKPTHNEFEELLTNAEIFSYNGHGSGSKYFSMEKIQNVHIKTVVLLFGCGSTKVYRIGAQTEMYGTYQMYILACSPCIIGMLWEVTDIDTDILTTEFLSCWVPSKADIHWKHVDQQKWKLGNGVEFPTTKIPIDNPNGKEYHQSELLKALSASKSVASYYFTKAACVARGIPCKINCDYHL